MVRRHIAVVALIAAGTAIGCGGGGDARTAKRDTTRGAAPTPATQVVAIPRAALRRCAALAPRRDIPVLCPTRLPSARWFDRYQTLAEGRSQYLTDLQTRPEGSGAAFHVLAGGRRGRFPLTTTQDGKWPVDTPPPSRSCCAAPGDLGLIGARPGKEHGTFAPVRLKLLRRTTVDGRPALLLRVAGYPNGGVHGGHLAIVWNQGDNGYTLSMHFAERTRLEVQQEAVVVQAAIAMSRFTARDAA
jgi:hypothetical protein